VHLYLTSAIREEWRRLFQSICSKPRSLSIEALELKISPNLYLDGPTQLRIKLLQRHTLHKQTKNKVTQCFASRTFVVK